MSKVFLKIDNERFELVDKETGELKELKETIVVDEDMWMKLYVNTFFYAIGKMKSLVDIKVFACCLKFAVKREEGNIILTSESSFKKKIKEECNINEQNLCRSLTRLCDSGLLYKNRRAEYIINPQVAYLGNKAERAKLILEIISK